MLVVRHSEMLVRQDWFRVLRGRRFMSCGSWQTTFDCELRRKYHSDSNAAGITKKCRGLARAVPKGNARYKHPPLEKDPES